MLGGMGVFVVGVGGWFLWVDVVLFLLYDCVGMGYLVVLFVVMIVLLLVLYFLIVDDYFVVCLGMV